MAAKVEDDQYIDMEITSHSNFFFCHNNNPREEFEFQIMSSSSSSSSIFHQHKQQICSSSSPADLLFYKGKLLPLDHHLLLQNSNSLNEKDHGFEEYCNVVSPSESCRFSTRELKLDNLDDDDDVNVMKTKRIVKNSSSSSSVGKKLRAWFGKASCKYYEAYHVTKVADEASLSKPNNRESLKVMGKKNPFGQIHHHTHRSFKYSSSSFSGHPNKSYEVLLQQYPKGNNNSEIGNSILAAIAHCKQSQQCFN